MVISKSGATKCYKNIKVTKPTQFDFSGYTFTFYIKLSCLSLGRVVLM